MATFMTIENICFDKWCDLLNNTHSNRSYIYERQDNRELVVHEKNATNAENLKKISLCAIVDKCYAFQNANHVFSSDAIKSINDIKLQVKQKYYTDSTTLKTTVDSIINWISNKGFATDVNRIDNFIYYNKKIDAKNHIEHLENEVYKEHNQRTNQKVGSGLSASVYYHKADKALVVKESSDIHLLKIEFELGFILDTPYVAKSKRMYVLKKNDQLVAQLLMEKITGTTVKDYVENKEKINVKQAITALENAKECSLDLFRQKIVWADLNGGNIFITEKGLKICDLGFWEMREDEKVRGRLLLIGAMQLIDMTLTIVEGMEETKKRDAITYPKSFFEKEWDYHIWCHITFGEPLENSYIPNDMDEIINKKLCESQNIEEVITHYFDSVIKNLSHCFEKLQEIQ